MSSTKNTGLLSSTDYTSKFQLIEGSNNLVLKVAQINDSAVFSGFVAVGFSVSNGNPIMFTVVKTTVGSDVRTKNIPNGLEAYKDSVGFIYLKFKEGADHAFLLLEGTKRKCLVEVEDTPLPSDAVLLTEFL